MVLETAQRIQQNYQQICRTIKPNTNWVKDHLIAVTKTIDSERIEVLLQLGHQLFGENKVQESKQKWPGLKQKYPNIQLHLLGPLQSNKVKDAVQLFNIIQSLSREKIAVLLAQEEQRQGKKLAYYIQVNTGAEPQKNGVLPKDCGDFVKFCQNELKLNIQGLMCVPPALESSLPHFQMLKDLASEVGLCDLSIGMSQDYQLALPFSPRYIRVGSAIFGARA